MARRFRFAASPTTSTAPSALADREPNPRLVERLAGEAELHAPHVIDLEVTNVLRRLVARGEIELQRAEAAMSDYLDLPLVRYPHLALLDRLWELGDYFTAYDAVFVALSEALDAPLVTLDARLARGAGHRTRSRHTDRRSSHPTPTLPHMPATPASAAERRGIRRLVPGPRLRLALLAVAVVGAYATFVSTDLIEPAAVRAWVESWGPAAPLLFVPVSAILGLLLVPGPVLAGASGLLFGPAIGTAVTLAASVASATGALVLGRVIGREGVERISGRRIAALTMWLEEYGFEAVVVARLAPLLPDSPTSYAAGATGVRTWQVAAGTAVGAAPRAFAYTALGGSLEDLTSPIAIVAVAVIVLASVAGAEGVRRHAKRSRSARAALAEDAGA